MAPECCAACVHAAAPVGSTGQLGGRATIPSPSSPAPQGGEYYFSLFSASKCTYNQRRSADRERRSAHTATHGPPLPYAPQAIRWARPPMPMTQRRHGLILARLRERESPTTKVSPIGLPSSTAGPPCTSTWPAPTLCAGQRLGYRAHRDLASGACSSRVVTLGLLLFPR